MAETDWVKSVEKRDGFGDQGVLDAGIIVYGSLLDPRELWYVFSRQRANLFPVKVRGYRRLFNKWVSERLRSPEGDKTAGVLNLAESDDSWFNGILVSGIPKPGFHKYAHREKEYGLTRIFSDQVDFYSIDKEPPKRSSLYTCYLPAGDKIQTDLRPIPSYVDVCVRGAEKWGSEFYDDFLDTCWVQGKPLRTYLGKD